jgi:hypothetical protein
MNGEWPALWVLIGSLLGLGLLQGLTRAISGSLGGGSRSGTELGPSRYPGGRRSRRKPRGPGAGLSWYSGHPGMLGALWRYFYGGTSRR